MEPCAKSETGDTTGLQPGKGGSIPTLALHVRECRFSEIRHVFEEFHYKGGHMGGGISVCYAAESSGSVVGGLVIGKPRHSGKYSGLLEFRRMAMLDSCPKNSESRFMSIVLRLLRKSGICEGVLSYADGSVGHAGTIYAACNFVRVGETSPSKHVFWNGVRYHPRSLTIERPYSHRLRAAVIAGEAIIETGKPKSIWVYRFHRASTTKCA